MITPTYPLQSLGASDQLALAIEQYSGMVLGNFPFLTSVWPFIAKRPITAGNSVTFPAIGDAVAYEHNPGTDLQGDENPLSEERTVPVDTKELVTSSWITRRDEFIAHFDFRAAYARSHSAAIARTLDSRALRMIALGARQASRANDTFPSGVRVQNTTDGISTAYAPSSTGATALELNLSEMGQKFDERNIPRAHRYAFLSPYLHRVAAFHANVTSVDYTTLNPNARANFKVNVLGGFNLIPTNQLGATGMGIVSDGESAYQGTFNKTAVLCIADPLAVGGVEFGGIDPFGPEYHTIKRSTLLGAGWFGGIKWLHPEACGEIYCSSTTYPA